MEPNGNFAKIVTVANGSPTMSRIEIQSLDTNGYPTSDYRLTDNEQKIRLLVDDSPTMIRIEGQSLDTNGDLTFS